MLTTKRRPAPVGEILVEEFMRPLGLTQGALAGAMGVPRKHVNQLCNDRRAVTAPTALILARVFGDSPDFWLNVQRRTDLWEGCIRPASWREIERAKLLPSAARSRSAVRASASYHRSRANPRIGCRNSPLVWNREEALGHNEPPRWKRDAGHGLDVANTLQDCA